MEMIKVEMKESFLYLGQRINPLITVKDDRVTSIDLSKLVIIDTNTIKHFKLFMWIIKIFTKRYTQEKSLK